MDQELIPGIDPQDQKPVGFCPVCGREIYSWNGACSYCLQFPE